MSNSSTYLDVISESQAGKATTANALFDATSPASFGGRRASACSGLTWGYYGGDFNKSDGSILDVPNGTLTLAANSTNRVYVTNSGGIATLPGSTAASDELYMLYSVATGPSTVTSYHDNRFCYSPPWHFSRASIDVASGDGTLSGPHRRCKYLTITGALSANRNVITPNEWQGVVYNNTTNAYTVTVKTSAGTGIVVGQGKRCMLLADGTNVVRITADV